MHRPRIVRGVITNRDVFRHAATIVREFGPAAYARCLVALVTGRPRTFLAAIHGDGGAAAGPRRLGSIATCSAVVLLVAISVGLTHAAWFEQDCSASCAPAEDQATAS